MTLRWVDPISFIELKVLVLEETKYNISIKIFLGLKYHRAIFPITFKLFDPLNLKGSKVKGLVSITVLWLGVEVIK